MLWGAVCFWEVTCFVGVLFEISVVSGRYFLEVCFRDLFGEVF